MNTHVAPSPTGDNVRPLITEDQLKIDFAHVEAAVAKLEAEADAAPPALEDDDDLAVITGLDGKLGKFAKRIDDIRDEQKAPFREAGDLIQRHFKALEARCTTARAKVAAIGKRYLDKKRADEEAARRAEEARLRAIAEEQAKTAKAAMNAGDLAGATAAHNAATAAETRAAEAAKPAKPSEATRTATAAGTASLQGEWKFEITDFNALVTTLGPLGPQFTRTEIEKAIRAFVRKGHRELSGVRIYQDTAFRTRT